MRDYPGRPSAAMLRTMLDTYQRTGSFAAASRAVGKPGGYAGHHLRVQGLVPDASPSSPQLTGAGMEALGAVPPPAPGPPPTQPRSLLGRMREALDAGRSVFGQAPAQVVFSKRENKDPCLAAPAIQGSAPKSSQRQPERADCAVIISDVHHPVHDPRAWACVLKAISILRPSVVVCAGDMLEVEAANGHADKQLGGAKRHDDLVAALRDEAAAALRDVVRPLLQAANGAAVHWLDGNHERRAEHALRKHGLELVYPLSDMLKLQELGIIYHPEAGATVDLWGWLVEHGDARASGGGGLYAARWRASVYQRHVVFGHLHTITSNVLPSAAGPVVGLGNGCLCDIERAREWAGTSRHRWRHGFTVLRRVAGTGRALVESVEIVNGRCVVDGRLVRG